MGLDLVAIGDGDLAHVLAKARDLEAFPVMPGARRPSPGPDALLDLRVTPVADDYLAFEAHPGRDEPELAVAVGRLVQVHEVHVDPVPGDLAVVLGVEVEQWPLEAPQAGDPHLGRRERVHPRHESDAVGRCVGLHHQGADLVGAREDRLDDDPGRDRRSGVQPGRDLARITGDRGEGFRSVEVLAAGDEPDFGCREIEHVELLGLADGGYSRVGDWP